MWMTRAAALAPLIFSLLVLHSSFGSTTANANCTLPVSFGPGLIGEGNAPCVPRAALPPNGTCGVGCVSGFRASGNGSSVFTCSGNLFWATMTCIPAALVVSSQRRMDGMSVGVASGEFGRSVAVLNISGGTVLAVGSPREPHANGSGAVTLLFLKNASSGLAVLRWTKIIPPTGSRLFGVAVAAPGVDWDQNGVEDLVVSDSTWPGGGAVWIVTLSPSGTAIGFERLDRANGHFRDPLPSNETARVGTSLASLDVDGDRWPELAVGNPKAADSRGAVFLLWFRRNGTVWREQLFHGPPGRAGFGRSVAPLGQERTGLTVGANVDGPGGAVWTIQLANDGNELGRVRTDLTKEFNERVDPGDWLGQSLVGFAGYLAIGAMFDDDGGPDRGAVWICALSTNATPVRVVAKISSASLGPLTLPNAALFGDSVATLDATTLVVGAGGMNALFILGLQIPALATTAATTAASASATTGAAVTTGAVIVNSSTAASNNPATTTSGAGTVVTELENGQSSGGSGSTGTGTVIIAMVCVACGVVIAVTAAVIFIKARRQRGAATASRTSGESETSSGATYASVLSLKSAGDSVLVGSYHNLSVIEENSDDGSDQDYVAPSSPRNDKSASGEYHNLPVSNLQ
jgi:FG-GAP repeat